MADELENMKRLAGVKVTSIVIDTRDRVIFTLKYNVVADDDTVMYQSNCTHDMTDVPNIGNYTITQMNAWAKSKAMIDAKAKWGK